MKENIVKEVQRNSGIELLKIIGMVLIAICHAVPVYGEYNLISYVNINVCTTDISVIIMAMFRYLGAIGNVIFVVSSAWFLVDSDKIRKEKVINIILNNFIVSLIFLVSLTKLGVNISEIDIKKALTPAITSFNWFVTCYLVLYLIHPLLNMTIEKLQQKELLKINIIFFIVYVIIGIYNNYAFFRSSLLEMIIIYYNIAYIKLYRKSFCSDKKENIGYLIIGIVGLITEILIVNVIGLYTRKGNLYLMKMYNMLNPFINIIIITTFNLLKNVNIRSKIINYISSLSLLFYIIHENSLFAYYVRPKFYQLVFKYGHRIGWILIEAAFLIIFGIIGAIIYKETIGKIVKIISVKIKEFIEKSYRKIEERILKLD